MLGKKTPPTREAALFLRGHLENCGSKITATRKLSKWVVFTRQGKLKPSDNKRGIVAAKLRLIKNHIVATVEAFGFLECFARSVVKLVVLRCNLVINFPVSAKGKVYLVQHCHTAEVFQR